MRQCRRQSPVQKSNPSARDRRSGLSLAFCRLLSGALGARRRSLLVALPEQEVAVKLWVYIISMGLLVAFLAWLAP
jgi:hypothetical protein